MLPRLNPFEYFTDTNGDPLDGGYVYIGSANQNPKTSPVTVYFDSDMTIPAPQPLRTTAGRIVRSGSAAAIYSNAPTFSILIENKSGQQVAYTAEAESDPASNMASLAASSGSSLVGFIQSGTGAAAKTVQDKLRETISVKDFGAKGDGVTDDSAAIRKALDTGKDVDFGGPENTYYVGSVVYIPRGSSSRRLFGSATIKGQGGGTGTIFESGQSSSSTGGVSNWGFPEVYKHYNTVIEGLRFKDCEFALKVYNFLQGCVIRDCAFENCRTNIYAKRSFYLAVLNNATHSANDQAVAVDTDACFRFEEYNNAMVIQGNSAQRSNITKGSGFHFSAGTQAVEFSGNAAERCGKGVYVGGAIYGMNVEGNYLEGNTVDLYVADGNLKRGLHVDKNWFKSATAVEAVAWESGELGKNNHYNTSGAVTISNTMGSDGSLNSLVVYLPRMLETDAGHRTAAVIPANWSLNGSIIVKRQFTTYLNATGPSASRHMLAEDVMGSTQIVPRHFVGRSNLRTSYADGGIPFATMTDNTNPGPGNLVIDTQLAWDTREMGARFDFYIADSGGNHQLGGWVNGTAVFRDDASAKTVTAAINGSNNLQLTIGSFTVVSAARGGVRIL